MAILLRYVLLTLVIINIGLPDAWAGNSEHVGEINGKVSQLVDLLKDQYASEYKEGRSIKIYDLGKKEKIAIAIFSVEGIGNANNRTQYLSVFYRFDDSNNSRPPRFMLLDVMAIVGYHVEDVNDAEKGPAGIIITLDTKEPGLDGKGKKSQTILKIDSHNGGRLQVVR
jgi:hypothetical protein